jgi:putative phage-type endonuclease
MIEQGSAEWHKQRLGKVTASRIADVMAKTKTGYSTSRANYMADLLVERMTGIPAAGFVSPAMQWGIDTEPQARAEYGFECGVTVEQVGFCEHPTIPMCGASPDGKVPPNGLLEIKCPNSNTHKEMLLSKTIPGKYVLQMQHQMACTGRRWCDFVSFDPRWPQNMRLFIQRVEYDAAKVAEIEAEVKKFLAELDADEAKLRSEYGAKAAA